MFIYVCVSLLPLPVICQWSSALDLINHKDIIIFKQIIPASPFEKWPEVIYNICISFLCCWVGFLLSIWSISSLSSRYSTSFLHILILLQSMYWVILSLVKVVSLLFVCQPNTANEILLHIPDVPSPCGYSKWNPG